MTSGKAALGVGPRPLTAGLLGWFWTRSQAVVRGASSGIRAVGPTDSQVSTFDPGPSGGLAALCPGPFGARYTLSSWSVDIGVTAWKN
jgi:hypothetical protein